MEKLFGKFNKNVLFIICIVVAGIALLGGILELADGDSVGTIFNAMVLAGLLVLLGIYIRKGDATRVAVIAVLLVGMYTITGLGSGLTQLTFGASDDPAWACYSLFLGFALIGMFVGGVCQLLPILFDKMPAKVMKLISSIGYLAGIACYLVSLICFLCIDFGDDAALLKISQLIVGFGTMGVLFLLTCVENQPSEAAE